MYKKIVMFIVTGGGRGLGRALALALAKRKESVLIIGRDEARLKETANLSPLISYMRLDVSNASERQLFVDNIRDVVSLKGLIHNAGIIDPIAPIAEISESAWQASLATNLNAPFFLTQHLKDKLSTGRVLHIGSGAAYFPIQGWTAYCVSKAALAMLTRCWQLESGTGAMAVASVMPGIIDTDMQALIRHSIHMDPLKLDFFMHLKNNQQLLSPDTVATFLCWLLLDIDKAQYASHEWDIYDKTHHSYWLLPTQVVPDFEA